MLLGAILSQKDENGNEYVIAYASRLLKGSEKHYSITELECLAVVWAINHFRVYLYGNKFTLITDHYALKWLLTVNNPNTRLTRWAILLQSFKFDIVHKSGKTHTNVDALSRPILNVEAVERQEDEDLSTKNLDPYQDQKLIHFLKYGRHADGISKKQFKRINEYSKHFKLDGDVLKYRKSKMDDSFSLTVPKIEERQGLIFEAHGPGHLKKEAVFTILSEKFYWRTMMADVERFIKKCEHCLKFDKVPIVNHPALALPIRSVFDRIGIDLVLGLPSTEDGFIGILVIIEFMTRFGWSYPIKSKNMVEIAWILFLFISMFGPPKEFLSDRGKEFLNELIRNLCSMFEINKRTTSAYNPRCNGMTERLNQTLMSALKKEAYDNPTNWDKFLPHIMLAYNSRIHTSTKFSPYELLFGRKMNSVGSWECNPNEDEELALLRRSAELKVLFEKTIVEAKQNIEKSQQRQIVVQNKQKKVSNDSLPINAEVYIKSEKIQNKLDPLFNGPFYVVSQTEYGYYVINNSKGETLKDSFPRWR